ncbi:MAG: class I SAM-dependent methyltransferase [Thermoanaerobaculaceae bacterium]
MSSPVPPVPEPVCPVCGNDRWQAVLAARDMHGDEWFEIARCSSCGMRRTADGLSPAELSRYYDYPGGRDAGRRFVGVVESVERALRRRRAAMVEHLCSRPGSILDVGCGRGMMLAALAARGWDVWGTEVDEGVAATARQALGDRIRTGSVAAAGFAPRGFDVVTFFHALEHLVSPREELSAAAELVRPGGHVVIELPNPDSWQARWFGRHWLHLDVPRHRFHFTPELLSRLARQLGLVPQETRHFSLEYGPYPLLQSALAAAGLDHVLFTRLLRPAGTAARPRRALCLHLALSPLLGAGLVAAAGVELAAAAARRGGVVRMVLQRPSR